jgi:hypothetical protein
MERKNAGKMPALPRLGARGYVVLEAGAGRSEARPYKIVGARWRRAQAGVPVPHKQLEVEGAG